MGKIKNLKPQENGKLKPRTEPELKQTTDNRPGNPDNWEKNQTRWPDKKRQWWNTGQPNRNNSWALTKGKESHVWNRPESTHTICDDVRVSELLLLLLFVCKLIYSFYLNINDFITTCWQDVLIECFDQCHIFASHPDAQFYLQFYIQIFRYSELALFFSKPSHSWRP